MGNRLSLIWLRIWSNTSAKFHIWLSPAKENGRDLPFGPVKTGMNAAVELATDATDLCAVAFAFKPVGEVGCLAIVRPHVEIRSGGVLKAGKCRLAVRAAREIERHLAQGHRWVKC